MDLDQLTQIIRSVVDSRLDELYSQVSGLENQIEDLEKEYMALNNRQESIITALENFGDKLVGAGSSITDDVSL